MVSSVSFRGGKGDTNMPLIGITSCRKLEDYKQSILHVGGEVRIVDSSMAIDEALAGVDGLHADGRRRRGPIPVRGVAASRDSSKRNRAATSSSSRSSKRRAIARLPIFAICRGIQVLNVACGGTLVQDIPSELPGALAHALKVPPNEPYTLAHEVWLEKGSLLSNLMRERLSDADDCEVNSRHHQAVKNVASGFTVSATAPDGIIEAIEDPASEFCLGVQWHPENFWRTGEFRPLFEGFLAAAKSDRRKS